MHVTLGFGDIKLREERKLNINIFGNKGWGIKLHRIYNTALEILFYLIDFVIRFY